MENEFTFAILFNNVMVSIEKELVSLLLTFQLSLLLSIAGGGK